jgi:GntR family transcriptional regulator, transcriptional repressor for pyruvate dehydrogenase complex
MSTRGSTRTSHKQASTALTRQDLADNAADVILRAAVGAGLGKGDALPPVTRLAEEFGVSCAIVREALEKLADNGSIERDRGRRGWSLRDVSVTECASRPLRGRQAIAHASLADQAASAVLELIRRERLTEGDALPSTRELAERFKVSVLVMREAFVELAARGILDRRQGRETVVALPSHELISSILDFRAYLEGIDVDEFQRCRSGLEVSAAALAAGRGDASEKEERLEPLLDGMRAAKTEDEFNEHDLAFHMAIAHLCGNRAIEMLLASLNDLVRTSMDVTYHRVRSRGGKRGIAVAVRNHERIAKAIIRGDECAAAQAMEEHFSYFLSDGQKD